MVNEVGSIILSGIGFAIEYGQSSFRRTCIKNDSPGFAQI
jgi:hypothetical protein